MRYSLALDRLLLEGHLPREYGNVALEALVKVSSGLNFWPVKQPVVPVKRVEAAFG